MTRIHNPDQHELIWKIDEQILRLTTSEKSREWYTTQRYFVGDLLTEEFPVDKVMQVIENETSVRGITTNPHGDHHAAGQPLICSTDT